MLSAFLLFLGIAGVFMNSVAGWHPTRPRSKGSAEGSGRRHALTIASGLLTIAVLLVNGSSWIVQHLTHRLTVQCLTHFQFADNLPDCTVWGITINPAEPVKSLHLIIHFDQAIRDSAVARGSASPHTKIDAPCRIVSKSADRDEALTFGISSDRHEVIVNGHGISKYDAQSFVISFYPDPNYGKPGIGMDVNGLATYEAFGHELKAQIEMIDPINGQTSVVN